jgi:hypothetical protein
MGRRRDSHRSQFTNVMDRLNDDGLRLLIA